jgi:hypothetical protein
MAVVLEGKHVIGYAFEGHLPLRPLFYLHP